MRYFFNTLNNKFFRTKNDWIEYEEVDSYDPNYAKEDRKDYLTLVKLYFWYGQKQALLIYDEFKKIRVLLEKHLGTTIEDDGYGSSFEVFAISMQHNLSYEEVIENSIVHGPLDGGIDAIVCQNKNNYVYQIKFDDFVAPTCLDDNKISIRKYIGGKLSDPLKADLVGFLDSRGFNFNLPTHYFCITKEKKSEKNICSKDLMFAFLKGKVISTFDNTSLEFKLKFVDLELKDSYVEHGMDIFMFVSAYDFCESLNEIIDKDRIFDENVRRGLTPSTSIIRTVKKEASLFCLFNNGISVCCDNVEIGEAGVIIHNPMIINGQQTIRTLDAIFNKSIEESNKDKLKEKLRNVIMPVFVKKVDDKKIKFKIAKYNNTQKAIEENDFMALDENARRFQEYIYKESMRRHEKDSNYPILYLNLISNGEDSKIKNAKAIFEDYQIIEISDFLRLKLTIMEPKKIYSFKNKKNFNYDQTARNALSRVSEKYLLLISFSIYSYNKHLSSIDKNDSYYKSYLAGNLLIEYIFYDSALRGKKLSIDDCFEKVRKIQDKYLANNNDIENIVKFYKKKELIESYFNLETMDNIV